MKAIRKYLNIDVFRGGPRKLKMISCIFEF